jgi:hypothetical protein
LTRTRGNQASNGLGFLCHFPAAKVPKVTPNEVAAFFEAKVSSFCKIVKYRFMGWLPQKTASHKIAV